MEDLKAAKLSTAVCCDDANSQTNVTLFCTNLTASVYPQQSTLCALFEHALATIQEELKRQGHVSYLNATVLHVFSCYMSHNTFLTKSDVMKHCRMIGTIQPLREAQYYTGEGLHCFLRLARALCWRSGRCLVGAAFSV